MEQRECVRKYAVTLVFFSFFVLFCYFLECKWRRAFKGDRIIKKNLKYSNGQTMDVTQIKAFNPFKNCVKSKRFFCFFFFLTSLLSLCLPRDEADRFLLFIYLFLYKFILLWAFHSLFYLLNRFFFEFLYEVNKKWH